MITIVNHCKYIIIVRDTRLLTYLITCRNNYMHTNNIIRHEQVICINYYHHQFNKIIFSQEKHVRAGDAL